MHAYIKNTMPTREDVLHFLSTEQQLLGYGYGHGTSQGFGNVHGSGYGSGSFGSGSGSDLSTGYGWGDGSGCGHAIGDGDGDISYNSYNKDIKVFNGNSVDYINDFPIIITQVHYNLAYGYILNKDLTIEPCFIAKVGSSFGIRKNMKDAFDDAKNIEMERYLSIMERLEIFE